MKYDTICLAFAILNGQGKLINLTGQIMATGNKTALLNSYLNELIFTGEAQTLNSTLSLSIKKGEHFLNINGANGTHSHKFNNLAIKQQLKKLLRKYVF